jgi:hypothetical protein
VNAGLKNMATSKLFKFGIAAAVAGACFLVGSAFANYAYRDGNGTVQYIFSFVCQTTTICPGNVIIDSSGTEKATPGNPIIVGGTPDGTTPKPLKTLTDGTLVTSSSIVGFTPASSNARGTPIAVLTFDSSGPLPTGGPEVVVSDVGANLMYCNVNGVGATAADQPISPGGGWFTFVIPNGTTTLHCIAPGGSTTANMLAGSGIATGTGGGSGSSSSGDVNLTQIQGAVPSATNQLWVSPASGATFPVSGTFWPYTLGQQIASASVPVVLTAAQLATLTPPATVATTQSGSWTNTVVQPTGSNLHVVCDTGCSSSTAPADESAFTFGATSQSPVGGVYQTTATSNPLTNGQMGALQVTANRAVFSNPRNAAGTEIFTSSTPGQVTGVNGTFPATESGTWTVQPGNTPNTSPWLFAGSGTAGTPAGGVLSVQGVGSGTALPISAASLPLPTGAATSANQTNATQKTQIVDGSGNVIASTSNNLDVQCANCSGSGVSTADNATYTFGTSLFAGAGGVYQTTATSNPLTAGHQGFAQLTQYRAMMANIRDNGGNDLTATAYGSTPSGNALSVNGFVTNTVSVNPGTLATWGLIATGGGSAPTNAQTVGAEYLSSPPTYTTGQSGSLQMTAAGSLHTTVDNGAGTGNTGSAVPSSAAFVGGDAQSAEPSKATTGNLTGTFLDLTGKTVTSPYANRENQVRGSVTSTDTAAHTIIAAGGASIKTYITDIELSRSDAGTAAITVTMSDAASTPFVVPNNGGGGGREIHFQVPLVTAANTDFTCTSGTSTTTVTCNAQGFTGY